MIGRSKIIRTVLLVGAVVLMPLGSVTLAPQPAGALTFTPFTCSLGGTVTFDAATPGQGISKDGWASGDIGFEISYPTLGGGCSGSGGADFAYQSVACNHKTPGLPASNPACRPGRHGYNSWADVLGNVVPAQYRRSLVRQTFAGAIQGVTGDNRYQWYFASINGTQFSAKSVSTSLVPAGGACGPSELGFQSIAHIDVPHHVSQPMTVTLCLGAITGSGLNPGDNFYDASVDQIGIVDTAVINPATSTVKVG